MNCNLSRLYSVFLLCLFGYPEARGEGAEQYYNGPDDGKVGLDPKTFPEAPYGFMTWVNTDGDYYPGAGRWWAWGPGAGGSCVLWNHRNGIVLAGFGINTGPTSHGIPHIIESCIESSVPEVERKCLKHRSRGPRFFI